MKNVIQKAVRWLDTQIEAHVERQVTLRVYGDRREEYGAKR